ncbi:MAG: LptF/LptG family permease, partial [Myxococcales bacterium]|nr:LptF/LptG family permease [Myxococcales bacterium]
ESVDNRSGELRGIMLHDAESLDEPFVVFARRGRLYDDPGRKKLFLRLEEGEVHLGRMGKPRHDVLAFDAYDVDLALGGTLELRPESERLLREYTQSELRETIAKTRAEGGFPGDALVEYHERFAMPFVCVVFALLGIPLAVGPPRSGRSTGFIMGIFVTAVFFMLLRSGETLGREGTIPPWLSLWMPHLILGPCAIYLYRLAARERRFAPLDWFDRAAEWVAARLRRGSRPA